MARIQFLKSLMDKLLLLLTELILVLLVVDVSWQVLSRYLMSSPSLFTDEAARFLMVWMSFLGGAYLFGKNGHLSVTLLQDRLPLKFRACLALFTYLVITVFVVLVMIYGSWRLIGRTMGQPSPALGLPMGMFYSILPISALCIVYYMILNTAEFILSKGKLPLRSGNGEG